MISAKNKRALKIAALIIYDYFALIISSLISIVLINVDFYQSGLNINFASMLNTWPYLLVDALIMTVMFNAFGLYTKIWKYASVSEMLKICLTVAIITLANFILCLIERVSFRWIITYAFITLVFFSAIRFGYRIKRQYFNKKQVVEFDKKTKLMIVGAGEASLLLLKDLQSPSYREGYKAVCLIDDNPNKIGNSINNVVVVGNTKEIPHYAEKYAVDEIVICMPTVDKQTIKRIYDICKTTKCNIKIMPSFTQFVNGEVGVSSLKKVEIEDLLGRAAVKTNLSEVANYITDKVVLITGGGGSIGSELSRQVAKFNPKQLVLVDIYENNIYDIEQELKRTHPELNLLALVASVRDEKKIDDIFKTYKPEIVFHAAAHKHVPLMETSPKEAIKNNVFGTLNVVNAADKHGVKRFVLISTDKAVNPTNVMGATKRMCEMIIQAKNKKSKTDYVAVRFGNVLGSNGSVIPLFKKQIENGGPVTITHKDIIRYFMTIPEAVSLVMQAGAYALGGEIFVLDMGEPVKIYDLAYSLIKYSGLEPNVDIEIKEIGLRPGEKLYEELLMAEEGLQATDNKLIHIGKPVAFDEEVFFDQLKDLKKILWDEGDIRPVIQSIVSTYTPTDNK